MRNVGHAARFFINNTTEWMRLSLTCRPAAKGERGTAQSPHIAPVSVKHLPFPDPLKFNTFTIFTTL